MASATRSIFKNVSLVSFKGNTVFGVKGMTVDITSDTDRDGADNESNNNVFGTQNYAGTVTLETGDIGDVVAQWSVGESGSLRSSFVAKQGTSVTLVIASAWCNGINANGVFGDVGGATATFEINAGSVTWS
jgi:hypothetical protein